MDSELPSGGVPDLSPTALRGAVRSGRVSEILASFRDLPPVRRAELFVQLRVDEQKAILAEAPPPLVASILADCDSASLEETLLQIDPASIAPALRLIPPDALADILLHLPEEAAAKALEVVDPQLRADVRKLMTFDPKTAGGLMTTRYLSVPEVVTIERALEHLRASGRADTPSYIYIVDAYGKLVGVAPLRGLLMARPQDAVRSIMVGNVTKILASEPQEEVVRLFRLYHYVSLPVVDDKDRLIGIVTLQGMKSALQSGEEQVIRAITGVDSRERLKETLVAARGRIPWITVTILGGLGCAAIAAIFKRTLEEMVVLGLFMPVVLALGESIGAQTTTVVLATFAGGGVSGKELAAFLFKEVLVGLLAAVYSGAVVSAASLLWHGNPRMGGLIGASVFISVSWAALLAVLIPGMMKRLRVNPAIASGPLVLALADFSTLLVYFGGATALRSVLQ